MVAPAPLPPGEPVAPGREDAIFNSLVESNPQPRKGKRSFPVSVAIHLLVFLVVFVLPLYWSDVLPPSEDPLRAFIWNPPAAAAAPLPKGREAGSTPKPHPTPEPQTPTKIPDLVQPTVEVTPEKPPDTLPSIDKAGDPDGSDSGTVDGQKGGVDGGIVGGTPDGVVGGCAGCTGDGLPDPNPDAYPRLVSQVRPDYPQDAFIKKVEGTVTVEAIVDATGHVLRPRIVRSIPILDAAAIACVKQWLFVPARHHGVAVAVRVPITVTFRIF